MFKNWKSTMAFFVFVSVYVYSVYYDHKSTIEATGFIALYSSIFMMFRSDFTTELISKIFDNITMFKDK